MQQPTRCYFSSQGRLRCAKEHATLARKEKGVVPSHVNVEPFVNYSPSIFSKALAQTLLKAANMEPFVDSSTQFCGADPTATTVYPALEGKIVQWLSNCEVAAPVNVKKYSIVIGHKTNFVVTKVYKGNEVKEYFRTKDNATYIVTSSLMDKVFNEDPALARIDFLVQEGEAAAGKQFKDVDLLDIASKGDIRILVKAA